MIRNGNRIRLTPSEKAFLRGLVRESVDPQTVEDYNAWIDHSIRDFSDTDPEQRLAKAVLLGMRIEA